MRANYTQISSPGTRMLSDGQIQEIYSAAKEVLECQGSLILLPEARELLLKAGAMEGKDGKVLIPSTMVDQAVSTAPKFIKLYDRDGKENMKLEGYRCYFGACCDTPEVLDAYTAERRPYVSSDWPDFATVMDYLPNMKFLHINGNATDMEPEDAYRAIGYAVMPNCRTTIAICVGNAEAAAELIEVAQAIAGGPEEFRRKPNTFCMAEPITPLKHGPDSLTRLLMCADVGMPIVYYGMQMQGVTAPATAAGTLVVSCAESLTGLVIHQLRKPGAPFIFGGIPGMMDMKTTTYSYGGPELTRNLMALGDISHYLNLPFWGTSTTDSKRIDAQCASEFAITALAAILGGHNLVHDAAQMDRAALVSLQAAVLHDEIIGVCKYIVGGIEVNDEEMALGVIDKVGAAGNYLSEKHTMSRFKGFWTPGVFDRSTSPDVPPIETRINDKVKQILENHKVPPLPEDKLNAIAEVKAKWDKKKAK